MSAAREANPRMLVVAFQVWAREPKLWRERPEEAKATGLNSQQAHVNIRKANAEAVASVQKQIPEASVLVSPVGDFWRLALEQAPDVALYDPDGTHSNKAGTYLAGLVIAGSIGGRAVLERTTSPGQCPVTQAEKLRKVVLDHPEVFKEAGK